MSHPVIPAPARFDAGPGQFALRSGLPAAYAAAEVAPIVERFCAEVQRRTGLRVAPTASYTWPGYPGPDERAVRIELATGGEFSALPAPVGIWPSAGARPDERYSLAIDPGQVLLRAAEPAGVARGLTTLIQLLAAAPSGGTGEIVLPGARIADAPRYAWRGLSLDVARTFFTPGEVRQVIDLLALYKLNVLHLHLTDDQGWRLPVGRTARDREPGAWYSAEELRALVAYAADRFVTVVPEVDMPGHASALLRLRPELSSGRNEVERESPSGEPARAVWLDPELPATHLLVEEVLAGVAGLFPGPYLHLGGDEPFGMPHDLYVAFVRRARDVVRSAGRRPVGWQESARAGLGPDDTIQYWFSGIAFAESAPPEFLAQMDADLVLSRQDVDAAAAASARVIVSPMSHCYLDVPYAEPSADPAQAVRQRHAGLRLYAPVTVAESFDWEPAGALGAGRHPRAPLVAGVEAAIWTETVFDFGDLTFLLLPRLPGVAHKAWSEPDAGAWAGHRDRLARHGRLWAQDDLTYFRTSTVNWLAP